MEVSVWLWDPKAPSPGIERSIKQDAVWSRMLACTIWITGKNIFLLLENARQILMTDLKDEA